jgi:MYXO-CTERM domain-containing protein
VSEGEPRLCIEPDRRASFEPLCHARASAMGSTRPPIALASLIALGAVAFVRTTSRRRADGRGA